MTPFVIAMLVFGTVLLAAMAAFRRAPEQAAVAARLQEIEMRRLPRQATLSLPFSQRVVGPLARSLGEFVLRHTPSASVAAVRANLLRAGNRRTDPIVWILGRWLRACVLAVIGLLLVLVTHHAPVGRWLLFPLVLGGFGYLWPGLTLRRAIQRRQARILRELPEQLDLLTVVVEAGMGLDQALEIVAARRPGPISDEIRAYLDEVGLGAERQAAMKAIGTRTGVEDLVSFTSTLVQAMEFGVSIAQVLRVQSDEARTRRRQRIEERAYKAPVKMLFPLIFLILPALFVVVAGPGFIRMYTQFVQHGPGGFGAPPSR